MLALQAEQRAQPRRVHEGELGQVDPQRLSVTLRERVGEHRLADEIQLSGQAKQNGSVHVLDSDLEARRPVAGVSGSPLITANDRIMRMSSVLNPQYRPAAVPPPSGEALAFHRALPGYAPTPVRDLGGGVWLKDESDRFGLPAFKVLGVSWAVERALREDPEVQTLVAASAGNHGRAVAHVAAQRGLRARVFLPARSVAARREAIAGEGADVVIVDGTYEDAVRLAAEAGAQPGRDRARRRRRLRPRALGHRRLRHLVRRAGPGVRHDLRPGRRRVARRGRGAVRGGDGDGGDRGRAGRRGVPHGLAVAGEPTVVDTPGTAMAGLDCAEVSEAAWPTLRHGIRGTVTVSDEQTPPRCASSPRVGSRSGTPAPRPRRAARARRELRAAVKLDRVLLIATEGPTDPEGYRAVIG